MLGPRSLLTRIALLLLLIFSSVTLVPGNISVVERSEADVSGALRASTTEIDHGDLEVLQPAHRSMSHRARVLRSAARSGEGEPRFTLVADLRPVRLASPVPHPPLRRPPPRLLN